MTFMYPLALLGLLGIPAVIIIYILQSKYTEQTVTSTYIWKLSDKFLKRKNPFSGLTGLISLLLQILLITVVSFAIARPTINMPGEAYDYCFVLDASSSMSAQNGESTRFQQAKEQIIEVIEDSTGGSLYTLALVSNETELVFVSISDKDTAIDYINELQPGDTASTHEDLLSEAQDYFTDHPASLIYLVTDKHYSHAENVELIHVGGGMRNYAVSDATFSHEGGSLNVSANVTSYSENANLTVALFVDDTKVAEKSVAAKMGTPATVSFEQPTARFNSFKLQIVNGDDYAADNELITYNLKSDKTYSTLIVSESGFFLESVLDALLDSDVITVTPKEWEKGIGEKYGLYIFDSYEPAELPDGAVWLINADTSIPNSGFGVRGKVDLGGVAEIEKSDSTATNVRRLLQGVDGKNIHIVNYVKYSSMYLPFHTLFVYDSTPLIFAGANGLGNRQVVIGFDLHESDFVLSTDFIMLVRNLLNYSFPDVLDQTDYTVGEEAQINVLVNAENLKATTPSGEVIYLEDEHETTALALNEIGTYTVQMSIAGIESSYQLYACAAPDESLPTEQMESFIVTGERQESELVGKYDPLIVLFIALAVLFIADWGVFCYEKYQLR